MQEWLDQLKSNDSKAFEEIYRQAYPSCARIVLKNNGSSVDAKDIFQEALIVFLLNIRKPNFELTCKIETYLYAVVMRLWLKRLENRGQSNLKLVLDDLNVKTPDVVIDTIEEKSDSQDQLLSRCLEVLEQFGKEDCKQVLKHYYFDNYTLKEIGDRLGYTTGYARKKKNNCLQYLKKEIEKGS